MVATVNTFPTAPVAVNGQVCGSGSVSISAAVASGVTVDWYAASTGGTALATGSTGYTTPSISTTTIYYAEARNATTGCISTTRTAVTATVNSYPVVPITGPQTACVSGSTTFANATGGGAWTSSSTVIATVSSAGVVTGVSGGTTNINYTVTGQVRDGCFQIGDYLLHCSCRS